MDAFLLLTAVWLGILTSISPCPLATNIAAISFISQRITHRNIVLLSGILYTIGRSTTYIAISLLIAVAFINIPVISDFLQRYINKILGIILIIVGMVILELFPVKLPSFHISGKTTNKIIQGGFWGALFVGMLFALAFCPVSAALFFGGLMPVIVKAKSSITLPMIYGVGTALPVLFFAVLISTGAEHLSRVYHKVNMIEFYAKKITGLIFIIIGIYYVLSYIFEIL
ncbi:MAG: aromatic aminobenezylarsenical efflux permease ArsG family transporter [Thermodesulfovibrionales bacterium]